MLDVWIPDNISWLPSWQLLSNILIEMKHPAISGWLRNNIVLISQAHLQQHQNYVFFQSDPHHPHDHHHDYIHQADGHSCFICVAFQLLLPLFCLHTKVLIIFVCDFCLRYLFATFVCNIFLLYLSSNNGQLVPEAQLPICLSRPTFWRTYVPTYLLTGVGARDTYASRKWISFRSIL